MKRPFRRWRFHLLLHAFAWPMAAAAQGHGPAYGLSTPTLGRGGWSIDVAMMGRFVGSARAVMLRPMLSYGVTADLQVSASVPLVIEAPSGLPQARGMSRMPTTRDVEALVGWRFHRTAPGVGSRFESTAYLGADVPLDRRRAGAETAPALVGGIVTGYASRSLYLWVGGLRRQALRVGDDRLGHVTLYSAVVGLRPGAFRRDYPEPDWRVFLEVLGESATRTVVDGAPQLNTGGHQLFVGPTVLGLFGSWGVSGGPAFGVVNSMNGTQPREAVRFIVNVTWWF